MVIEELFHNTTTVESLHIKFNKILGRMTTTCLRRRPITTVDTKRFYINTLLSYAYHHPVTIDHGFTVGDVTTTKGCYIAGTESLIDLNDVRRFEEIAHPIEVSQLDVGDGDGMQLAC